MARTVEGLTIVINGDATPFKRAMREAKAEGTMLRKHMEVLNKLIQFDPGSMTLLTRRQQLLNAQLAQNAAHMSRLRSINDEYAARAATLTEAERRQWMQVQRRMTEVELEYARLRQQAIQYGAAASAANLRVIAGANGLQARLKTVSTQLMGVSAAIGLVGGASLYAAIQFESSFAGVRKTIIATEEEYARLARATRDLALVKPVSVNDINRIMELGGQLNIATRNLTEFASVMADLDVSTNMELEEGSLQMARFMNITNMAQSDVDRLGATIVDLGNNSATTEADIMLMAMRIAGSGRNIGLSAQNVLALATALSSVGIQAEMGGNAISTIMNRIDKSVALNQKTLSTWAQTAGMTTEEFRYNWTHNVQDTLIAVIKGLGEFRDEGGNLNVLLKDMGISYMRQIDTMQRLSRAGQLTEELFVRSNTAWANNTALVREATQRYSTAESKIKMMGNALYEAGIAIGQEILPYFSDLVVGVTGAIRAFASMDAGTKQFIITTGGIAMSVGLVVKAVEALSGGVAKVASAFASLKTWMVLSTAGAQAYSAQSIALATSLGADAEAAIFDAHATEANAKAKARMYAQAAGVLAAYGYQTAAADANAAAQYNNAVATAASTEATALNGAAAIQNAQGKSLLTVATEMLTASTWKLSVALGITNGQLLLMAGAVAGVTILAVSIANAVSPMNQLTKASQEYRDEADRAKANYESLARTQGEHADATVKAKEAYEQLELSMSENTETIGEFYKRMNDTVKASQDLRAEMRDATSEADTDAGRVLNLADAITSMRDASTQAEKMELATYISQLNHEVEGLDLTLSDVINDTDNFTGALKDVQDFANKIRLDNAYEQFSKTVGMVDELNAALAEMREQDPWLADYENVSASDLALSGANPALSGTLQQYQSLKAEADAATETMNEQAKTMQDLADRSASYELALRVANDANMSLADACEYASSHMGLEVDEAGAVEYQQQQVASATRDATDEVNEMAQSLGELSAKYPVLDTMIQNSGSSITGLAQWLYDAGISVEDFGKGIEEMAEKASDGLNRIDTESGISLQEFIGNLEHNRDAMRAWGDNMKRLWEMAGEDASQGVKDFLGYIQSLGPEQSALVQEMVDSGMGLDQIAALWGDAGQAGEEAYIKSLGALSPAAKALAQEFVKEVRAELAKAGGEWAPEAGKGADSVKARLDIAFGLMKSSASSTFNAVGDATTAVAKHNGSVYGWMVEFTNNLIAGIKVNWVAARVNEVANTIAAALKHSIPEEGPLHNHGKGEAEWTRHMMDNLIEGIRSREDALRAEMAVVAGIMANPVPDWDAGTPRLSAQGMAALAGGTYNITVNAKTDADPDEIAGAIGRRMQLINMSRGR